MTKIERGLLWIGCSAALAAALCGPTPSGHLAVLISLISSGMCVAVHLEWHLLAKSAFKRVWGIAFKPREYKVEEMVSTFLILLAGWSLIAAAISGNAPRFRLFCAVMALVSAVILAAYLYKKRPWKNH